MELINIQSVRSFYRRNQVWIIFFFKTDQEECKKIRDEFKTLSEKMYGIIRIGAVDCEEDEEMCEEFLIFDTPTVMAFTDNFADDGEKYKGKYEWKKLASFATKKMQDFVSIVTNDNYGGFIDREKS